MKCRQNIKWNDRIRPLIVYCLLFSACCLLSSVSSHSQSAKIDSLHNVLMTQKDDSDRVNMLIRLALEFQGNAPDSSIRYGNMAFDLSKKITIPGEKQGWETGVGKSSNTLAVAYYRKGEYSRALDYYYKALSIWERMEQLAKKNGGQGSVSSYILSSKSRTLGNMGLVYWNQQDYARALKYYFQALKIDEDLGNKSGIGRHLGNIGVIYAEEASGPSKRMDKDDLIGNSLHYLLRAVSIFEELGNKRAIATVQGNIGNAYVAIEDYPKATEYYIKALKIRQELGAKDLIATTYGNLGVLYFKTSKYSEAERYLQQAIALSDTLGDLEGLREWQQSFTKLDSARSNFKGALEHYKQFIAARDSINNEENTKKQTQAEMQYEFDKKQSEEKAEQEKKDALQEAESRRQNIVLALTSFFLVFVLFFAGFVFRSLRITRRQKKLIEKQKQFVEEKQKEILDSIHYARRIQTALMPTEKYIDKTLKRLMANI